MSRDEGFEHADIDVTLLDDPKIRKLIRRCNGDEVLVARAVVGYLATVLGSWGDGERLTVEEAAPLWLSDVEELGELLAAAGLVDQDGRVPEHAWLAWFVPADKRREDLRAKWRRAKSKGVPDDSAGTPRGSDADSAGTPRPPSVPSSPVVHDNQVNPPAVDAREDLNEERPLIEVTEAVFRAIEARGARVDRSNGHATMLRELVAAHGIAAVLLELGGIDGPIANAGDAAKWIGDALRPKPRQRSHPGSDTFETIPIAERARRTRESQPAEYRERIAAANGDAPASGGPFG